MWLQGHMTKRSGEARGRFCARGTSRGLLPKCLIRTVLEGELMKLLLMASIFCTGVYLGLNAEPNGQLVQTMEQIKALMGGEFASKVGDLIDDLAKR